MTIRQRQWIDLAGWLALVAVVAVIGSVASMDAPSFYARLEQPDWAPPSNVFGPAWTTLYVLMGIAAWLVWRERDRHAIRTALALFVAQLLLNALWSWLFFAWHRGMLAFVDIVLLWALIAATLVAFWRIRPLAGALLVPYLAWVSFAMALNYAVWQANPGLLG